MPMGNPKISEKSHIIDSCSLGPLFSLNFIKLYSLIKSSCRCQEYFLSSHLFKQSYTMQILMSTLFHNPFTIIF